MKFFSFVSIMGKVQDFLNLFRRGSNNDEQRGYPISGNFAGWWSYLTNSLQLNNIATADCYDYTGQSAMRISTVYTCVLIRAESLSTMPASVKQATDLGSRTAYENPVHRLIHDKPNPFQTAADFWKSVSAHIDLNGNCFAIVSYSGRYQPTRIDLVGDPLSVVIKKSENGNAYYEYNGKTYASYEMLHFKDLSLDGYYGCSKVKYNASTIDYSEKLKRFGKNAIGVKPPGYFTTKTNFDIIKKQEESLSKGWSDNIALGKTPFLPDGLEYKPLQINPGDAQFLEAIGATKEDIWGIFRIPPTLAQNYERATYSQAEQQDLVFVKYTMLPIVTNIEQECNAKLFSEDNYKSKTPYYIKFNVNAFMRGDFKTRTEGYRTLWERGLITGNMVADLEDWDHFEGGDRRFVPMNMIPLDKVDEFIDQLTNPVDTNVGDQGGDPQARGVSLKQLKELLNLNGHKVNGHG